VEIPVVDVFAGPGGLNEGFQAKRADGSHSPFRTRLSIEKDGVACLTLRLRAAVRETTSHTGELHPQYKEFLSGNVDFQELLEDDAFRAAWVKASSEVKEFELAESAREHSDRMIKEALGSAADGSKPWVLVGGPPCQAYSLAGRSRRTRDESFDDDHKHTLYKEYLHIIQQFKPAVFVMENVKGMLSSRHQGARIFDSIRQDLTAPAPDLKYALRSLVVPGPDPAPTDFVIKAEKYGVPQSRHRVILLGIRLDYLDREPETLAVSGPVTVGEAIGHMPAIRSKVSRRDSQEEWVSALKSAHEFAHLPIGKIEIPPLGASSVAKQTGGETGVLEEWLDAANVPVWTQHESRGHMISDLKRYAFLALHGREGMAVPKIHELPEDLKPNHKNISAGRNAPFTDRFRVQLRDRPSSTVVSHIAKDGHYFIHHDPLQMRSLSVREAARLQTFPDDYFFMGNRTQQYHQVGNAVPPYLARQISEVVSELLV